MSEIPDSSTLDTLENESAIFEVKNFLDSEWKAYDNANWHSIKTICVLANGIGGTYVIGISEKGNNRQTVGVTNASERANKLSEWIKAQFKPRPPVFSIEVKKVEDKELIVVHVRSNAPRYLFYDGRDGLGCAIRKGDSSRQLSFEEIVRVLDLERQTRNDLRKSMRDARSQLERFQFDIGFRPGDSNPKNRSFTRCVVQPNQWLTKSRWDRSELETLAIKLGTRNFSTSTNGLVDLSTGVKIKYSENSSFVFGFDGSLYAHSQSDSGKNQAVQIALHQIAICCYLSYAAEGATSWLVTLEVVCVGSNGMPDLLSLVEPYELCWPLVEPPERDIVPFCKLIMTKAGGFQILADHAHWHNIPESSYLNEFLLQGVCGTRSL